MGALMPREIRSDELEPIDATDPGSISLQLAALHARVSALEREPPWWARHLLSVIPGLLLLWLARGNVDPVVVQLVAAIVRQELAQPMEGP